MSDSGIGDFAIGDSAVGRDTFSSALQSLAMDAYIELYELDTSPLTNVHGVQVTAGTVYRWTSGVIDVRVQGALPNLGTGYAPTTTTLYLAAASNLIAGRPYMIVVQTNPNAVPTPIAVSSFSAVTIAGAVYTRVVLALPLPATPSVGEPYALFGTNPVQFQGNTYTPMPIEMTGMEWSGQGKLPRPKLRISNIGGLAAALVIANGDMLGATVTRLRTLREFLDDGTNADPTAFADPDIFTIDRKSSHNKTAIEWELTPALDQQGKKIPGRVMIRDSCDQAYRQYVTNSAGVASFVYSTCPYSGTAYFDTNDNTVLTPSQDVCGLRLTSCVARFGRNTPLPFGGFPGISVTSA